MNPIEIADMVDRLKHYYVLAGLALPLVGAPDADARVRAIGLDPDGSVRLGRRDNSYYEGLRIRPALDMAQGNSGFNLDYLGGWVMLTLSWLGDALDDNNYFDRAPVLEAVRHLRNAASHGNTFHFKPGMPNPRFPAGFRGFAITAADQGKPVFFEWCSTGDAFDLFDDVAAHLRALP
jgi:hypothetical protein